jgi:diguanylate cyclase (GGDEF)-like protein
MRPSILFIWNWMSRLIPWILASSAFTLGHAVGDEALKHLATTCKKTMLATYIFARLGGEEFIALLLGCNAARASEVAEHMRAVLENTPLKLNDATTIKLTASFGVATGEGPDMSVDKLLQQADEAAGKIASRWLAVEAVRLDN